MYDVINEVKTKNHRAELDLDYNAESPREWVDNSVMVCSHGSYDLGDVQGNKKESNNWHDILVNALIEAYDLEKSIEELTEEEIEELTEDRTVYLPLYLYDHSGLTMNTTGFHSRWDSGQVGWIFMVEDEVEKNFTGNYFEKRKQAKKELKSQVRIYDQYIRGEIYNIRLYKRIECECCGQFSEEFINGASEIYDVTIDNLTSIFGEEYEEILRGLLEF